MSLNRQLASIARQGVVTVETVADLRAHPFATSPELVFETLGAVTAGDGGGGVWRWDVTSSDDDNLGTVVLPTGHTGAGRRVRVIDGNAVYAAWFVGKRTDDVTAGLQAAIDVAETNGINKVYLDAHTYNVSAPRAGVTLTVKTCSITGAGAERSVLAIGTSTETGGIGGTDVVDVRIADLKVDGQRTAYAGWNRGVVFFGGTNIQVERVHFHRLGGGPLTIAKDTTTPASDLVPSGSASPNLVSVINCQFTDSFGSHCISTKARGAKRVLITQNKMINSCVGGISIESQDALGSGAAPIEDVIVTDNYIEKSSGDNSALTGLNPTGIGINENVLRAVCSNNIIKDLIKGGANAQPSGIELGTSPLQTDTPCEKIAVTGNVIIGVTDQIEGFTIANKNTDIEEVLIANNLIAGNISNGVLLRPGLDNGTGTINKLVISGNIFEDTNGGGIYHYNLNDALGPADKIIINGNRIIAKAGTTRYGINLAGTNAVITNNLIERYPRAISFVGTAEKFLIANNQLLNNVDGVRGTLSSSLITGNVMSGNTGYAVYITTGDSLSNISGNYINGGNNGIRAPAGCTARNNDVLNLTGVPIWTGLNTGTYDAALNRTA